MATNDFKTNPRLAKQKRRGLGLETRTFTGKSGATYLVFRTVKGGYHTFMEVEAKAAAVDCGAAGHGTRQRWSSLWVKAS